MELAGKKVVVMGLAGSGIAAARFLAAQKARVLATDLKGRDRLEAAAELETLGVELVLGGHPESIFEGADLLVVSPGVPRDSASVKAALEKGIEVVSELELASRHVSAPLIAVTGTNGKTTTVTLAGKMMEAALGKENVFVGGNIGTPFIELPLSGLAVKAAVIEVSSFQLEFIKDFAPGVAALLNVTDDHLDRYRGFEDYAATKKAIFQNQGPDDLAVINLDDPIAAAMTASLVPRLHAISIMGDHHQNGMWYDDGDIHYRLESGEGIFMGADEIRLPGRHNLYNVMAAALSALHLSADMDTLRLVARDFAGLPHRVEFVAEKKGVRYYNDSKGTNAGAVIAAAAGFEGPSIILMGGQAKGCVFIELGKALSGKAKAVMAFGECRDQLETEMGEFVPVRKFATMDEALAAAAGEAAPGDVVILSPACASFDQFDSYKHRGEVFKRLVGELP